jgi:hypothetical protein
MLDARHPQLPSTESTALQVLHQTPIEGLETFPGCLEFAIKRGLDNLAAELLRRNVADMAQFPNYVQQYQVSEPAKWMRLYKDNRTYFGDLVPTLQGSFKTIVMPKPLLEIVAQFVRGPFQL